MSSQAPEFGVRRLGGALDFLTDWSADRLGCQTYRKRGRLRFQSKHAEACVPSEGFASWFFQLPGKKTSAIPSQ